MNSGANSALLPDEIVVSTDFSPASTAALCVGASVAHLFKTKLTILHVFQYASYPTSRVPVQWMIASIRKDVRDKLEEAKRTFCAGAELVNWKMIEGGVPAEEIEAFLASCGRPLLVIGTHAVAGMERFFLGSTAEEILRDAHCPVITVGPHVRSNIARDLSFHRVLLATDFSRASLAAVPFMVALLERAQRAPSSIRILHVDADGSDTMTVEDDRFAEIERLLNGNERMHTAGVAERVVLQGSNINISHSIVNEAERYSADLIVLGVRRASAFASHLEAKIAYQTIAAAPCPVLTVSS